MRKTKLNAEQMQKISGGNAGEEQRVIDQMNLEKLDSSGKATVLKPADDEVKISELLPGSEKH